MSDPRLLVPINVEALVVDESASRAEWVNLKPDFRAMNWGRVLGQQLEPQPLSPTTGIHQPGIHLHWALPDGLTHGTTPEAPKVAPEDHGTAQEANTKDAEARHGLEFPHVPNRWLVVRVWDRGSDDQPPALGYRAWVIESDIINNDPQAPDLKAWPNPDWNKPENAKNRFVNVGRRFELAKWPGETKDTAQRVNLTAVGYGDPAFAAYYPACRGILGFHDREEDLADVPEGASLTYAVFGWYSDSSLDPLQQTFQGKSSNDRIGLLDEFLQRTRWAYRSFEVPAEKEEKVKQLELALEEKNKEADRLNKKIIAENDRRTQEVAKLEHELENNRKEKKDLFERWKSIPDEPSSAEDQKLKKDLAKRIIEIQNIQPALHHQIDDLDKASSNKLNNLKNELTEIKKDVSTTEKELAELKDKLKNKLPTDILCHGMITGVKWSPYPEGGAPLGKPFRIAVADTAVDALAALFEEKSDGHLAKLLAIFQYDLLKELEKPGGDHLVDVKVHGRSFRPLVRGKRWDLLQKDGPAGPGSAPEDRSPPVPGHIRLKLENLNALQREINSKTRERDSLRDKIYTTWYKTVLNNAGDAVKPNGPDDQKRPNLEDCLDDRLRDLRDEVKKKNDEITDKWNQAKSERKRIEDEIELYFPGWELRSYDEPEFWRPNDPVVLLAGDAFERPGRHGEDGRYRDDGRLLCRLSGQEITRIKVKAPYQKEKEFGPTDMDAWGIPFQTIAAHPNVPPEVADLLREALLFSLDLKRARHVLNMVCPKNDKDTGHDEYIKELSLYLLDPYLKQLWEKARNPKTAESRQLCRTYKIGENDGDALAITFELAGEFPSPVMINSWQKNPWLPLFLQWQAEWIPDTLDPLQPTMDGWALKGHDLVRTEKDPQKSPEPVTISGTSILTPDSGIHLSERLRQYNMIHGNKALEALETAVRYMNVLGQSLGGFTDQLLMRRGLMELCNPGEGEKGPQFPPVYDEVKEIDWLSPAMDGAFFPLRSGRLKLERLWIIDAFGQFLRLEEQDPVDGLNTVTPKRLSAPDGTVRLQPRLAQAARLSMEWVNAEGHAGDETFNPVCGWILPNFFDKSLMIYDAKGYALGALWEDQKKSWDEVSGAQMEAMKSFHWVAMHGSNQSPFVNRSDKIVDPLGPQADPDLKSFVNGLLALKDSGQAFSELLDRINESLCSSTAAGSHHNPNLALLIGKPLALVRARIHLKVDGNIASEQGWEDQPGHTGGIEKLKFSLQLGDRRKWKDLWLGSDGLVGYFEHGHGNPNYSRFYPAFGLKGRAGDTYSKYGYTPTLSMDEPLDLTLLMDPASGVLVTSGILPQTLFPFPCRDLAETMESKQVVFFSGPIVVPESGDKIRIPRPSDVYGQWKYSQWAWNNYPDVGVWSRKEIVDVQKQQGQFPDPPPQIAEGWLNLLTAPLNIHGFSVKGKIPLRKDPDQEDKGEKPVPEHYEVEYGQPFTLSWSVTGAEAITLSYEDLQHKNQQIFTKQCHPLPTARSWPSARRFLFGWGFSASARHPGSSSQFFRSDLFWLCSTCPIDPSPILSPVFRTALLF